MWVSKVKSERKKEFIVNAIKLFAEKGYENTSINDILSEMEITKGSFYYNFKSKEDLLESIIDYLSFEIISFICNISNDEKLNAVEKLRVISSRMIDFRKNNSDLYNQLRRINMDDSNSYISKRLSNRILNEASKYMYRIFIQGIKENEFKIEAVDVVSKMYVKLLSMLKSEIAKIYRERSIYKDSDYLNEIKDTIGVYRKMIISILGISEEQADFLYMKENIKL